ncbi:MAG: class I SAM-dependent methyltransferase [Thermoleophilia bacterium]|nr:class I SAM-dependent methyltransferase [Thermoleophilia bacterium]
MTEGAMPDRRGRPGEGATWHYGVVAKWWAEFNVGGPEVAYFRSHIERHGQPALDAGCGTGRLLLPYVRDGLDVDGCDVSPDMVALCREAAAREGLAPGLTVQALHELDLPRRYRTIVACGVFGLGSTRAQDAEALRRLRGHLEPGGVLALDVEVPYSNPHCWRCWTKEGRAELPRAWPPSAERRRGSDGAEYELASRLVELDPLRQSLTRKMRARMWRDGELLAEEEHRLTVNMYFANELVLLLERAGFGEAAVEAGHERREPTPDDDFVVAVARA